MSSITCTKQQYVSPSLQQQFLTKKMYNVKEFLRVILLNEINNGSFFLPEKKAKFNIKDIDSLPYEVDEDYRKMQNFILCHDGGFDDFCNKFIEILGLILTDKYNDRYDHHFYLSKIDELIQILTENGIETIPYGKSISFWSGKDVKEFICNNHDFRNKFLIDIQIPAYSFLFLCAQNTMKEIKVFNGVLDIFRMLICEHLAHQARDVVNVYISSDNLIDENFIRVGNHFWKFELPILQDLKLKGIIKKINLYFFNKSKNAFDFPIEFSSKEAQNLRLLRLVPIKRKTKTYFNYFRVDFLPDESSVKTRITLGKLQTIIQCWREKLSLESI